MKLKNIKNINIPFFLFLFINILYFFYNKNYINILIFILCAIVLYVVYKNIYVLLISLIVTDLLYLFKNIQLFERFDISSNKLDISLEKFKQRFIIKKHFTPDICNWIVQESENYALSHNGWTTNRHEQYPTTDIPIKLIPSIHSFIMISFGDISHVSPLSLLLANDDANLSYIAICLHKSFP